MLVGFHTIKKSFNRKVVSTKYFTEQNVLKKRRSQGTFVAKLWHSPAQGFLFLVLCFILCFTGDP